MSGVLKFVVKIGPGTKIFVTKIPVIKPRDLRETDHYMLAMSQWYRSRVGSLLYIASYE